MLWACWYTYGVKSWKKNPINTQTNKDI